MKKLLIIALCFGSLAAFSEAKAQTTQSSTQTKDEFWGTEKAGEKGASTDAVGKRAEGLDIRLNTYESGRNKRFSKKYITNSKRMKAILKEEKKMLKKAKRDRKKLRKRLKN
ncbi:hypothetical protein ACFSKU_05835 [Pontibacter silvestris]|uniref:Uncharacterized protein n=1 Tax=Pontibacter silvestris TaxID=2305183 RepID=A0ABW4WUN8_9BACT|nr:hypothetical protein [Pontibacter silvestris]MCC9136353.1 hypothetical protein [Pontibacter silvestris]